MAVASEVKVEEGVRRLEELARTDPTMAVLAKLEAVALRATGEPGWVVHLALAPSEERAASAPLLHHAALTVDAARLRALLDDLSATLEPPRRVPGRAGTGLGSTLDDVLTLVQAALVSESERLDRAADALGADRAVLALLL